MFTSFILVHQDGEPLLININHITMVQEGFIFTDDLDDGIPVDEDFAAINNMIADELSGA